MTQNELIKAEDLVSSILAPPPRILPRDYPYETQKRFSALKIMVLLLLAVAGGNMLPKFDFKMDKSSEDLALKKDMELVKEILKGLVPTVDDMRKDLLAFKTPVSIEMPTDLNVDYFLNKPVRITSEKAYIRELASKESKSLLVVAKNTTLLAEKIEGDWYQVVLPVGGKGFVHKSITQLIEDSQIAGVESEKRTT